MQDEHTPTGRNLLPGMRYMRDLMIRAVADMERLFPDEPVPDGATGLSRHGEKLGRPKAQPEGANLNAKGKPITDSYWSRMTPEERKAEGMRRMLVAQGKAKSTQNGWRATQVGKQAKSKPNVAASWWSTASPTQKKRRLAAMAAGKVKHVNGAAGAGA